MIFGPLTDSIKVSAFVSGVKIDVSPGLFRIPPDLAKHTDINVAHELLPDNIETVGCGIVNLRDNVRYAGSRHTNMKSKNIV